MGARRRSCQALEQLVFGVEASPLRRLLAWAGCTLGDLRSLVAAEGSRGPCRACGRPGVFVTADEFRGRIPLRRPGLELALAPRRTSTTRGFPGGVAGTTSGSTGRRRPRALHWPFLAAEAAEELLLLDSHGLREAPLAFWMPGPPGIAGLHNLLAHAKLGRPPERWFSTSPAPAADEGLAFWVDRGWRAARRLFPRLGPAPEWVPAERAEEVAGWLARRAAAGGAEVLRELRAAGGERGRSPPGWTSHGASYSPAASR